MIHVRPLVPSALMPPSSPRMASSGQWSRMNVTMAASLSRSARETQSLRDFRSASSFPSRSQWCSRITAPRRAACVARSMSFGREVIGRILSGGRGSGVGSRESGRYRRNYCLFSPTPAPRPPTPSNAILQNKPMNPQTISRYRVGRLIGAGGMGEVYLAEDMTLNRKVALKLLPVRFTRDEERVRRFQREARAASALNHPNILTIYEIGEDDSVHYIATEYIEGQTLRERMSSRRLNIGEVLDIAIGVASALAAAHDAGIVHRDIKPENIMLRPDGLVKVLDFGLAKLAEPESALKDSSTGSVMGTLLYISPEQARAQQPDARSDLYALGAVMYEMVTGQPPVRGDNFIDIAFAIANV